MQTIKQLMMFPMLLTSMWLLWILAQQKGSNSVFIALFSFLAYFFLIWQLRQKSSNLFKFAIATAFLLIVVTTAMTVQKTTIQAANTTSENEIWLSFSKEEIEKRKGQQEIFIDFTAAWCITCQLNKKNVLNTQDVQKFFKDHNIYLVRADWTNYDAQITQALAEFGRNSVPLYVFYDKNGKAKVLPEILTSQMIYELKK